MSIQERVRQLPTPTDDTSQEFEAYKNRMGYDAAKMKSIRYKMSVYDEFLEELEARKKYHGTKAYCRLPRLLTQQGLTTIERVDDAG